MGRPLAELVVSDDEREQLVRWARRPKSAQALALRSRIVLACAGQPGSVGKSNTGVAKELNVSLPTVGQWRQRFSDHRLEGLHDEPRPGAPRTVTDEQVEAVVVKTLESLPKNATHWSTRSMARTTGHPDVPELQTFAPPSHLPGRRLECEGHVHGGRPLLGCGNRT